MEMGLILGLGVFVLGGVTSGTIALPQKFVKQFAWENTWGTFWFLTMVVLPAVVVPFCVKDVTTVWSQAGAQTVTIPLIFGFLWGIGCVTYGVAIHLLGLSLGVSLIMGTNVVVGSLLPLAVLHPEKLGTTGGCVILLGIAICVAGVALIGYAAALKGRAAKMTHAEEDPHQRNMTVGLAVAVFSGITSAGLNLGFAFSKKIPEIAIELGTPAWASGLASWQLVFWGGFAACGLVTGVLMFRNRTWKNYAKPQAAHDSFLSLTMAVLHFVTILLYGIGTVYLGDLGTSLGFAAFVSISIIVANILGFLTGEWKGASEQSVRWIITATGVLVVAVCVLGIGYSL